MLVDFQLNSISNWVRIKIRSATAPYGGATGLTSATSGLRISAIANNEATTTTYTVAASNVETIATLGTFAAPTAGKCRFREVDAVSHPGVYEIQFENSRFSSVNAKSLLITVTGTGLAECDATIPLLGYNPYNGANLNLTCLPSAAPATTGGIVTYGTGLAQFQPQSGKVNITSGGLTSSVVAQSFLDLVADAVADWALTNGAAGGPWEALTNLITRLSSARAGYLDNLSAGPVATASALSSVATTASAIGLIVSSTGVVIAPTQAFSNTGNWTGNLVGNVTGNVNGTVASVVGSVASVVGAVGSVAGNVAGNVVGSVGSVAGNVTGSVGSVAGNVVGSVGSVLGNVGGNLVGNVNGNVVGTVASVVGSVGSVVGAVGSVAGNVGGNLVGNVQGNVAGNVLGTVASVVGSVASVVGNIGGNVTGTVGSVVGAVGSVTGNVGGNVVGTVASVVGNVGGNVVGSVGSVTAGVTVAANGLDNISTAQFTGPANTWPKMLVQVWRKDHKKSTLNKNTGQMIGYGDDNTAVLITQAVVDDGTTMTIGAAV